MEHDIYDSVEEFLTVEAAKLAYAHSGDHYVEVHERVDEVLDEMSYGKAIHNTELQIEKTTAHPSISWAATHGDRLILNIGRTFNGEVLQEGVPLVAKIDTAPLYGKDRQPKYGNWREMGIWNIANQEGASEYFAPIYRSGFRGSWILQQRGIPIYPDRSHPVPGQDAILGADKQPQATIEHFVNEEGFEGAHDTKHGNIGILDIDTDSERFAYLDYGSHFTHPEYSPSQQTQMSLSE